MALITQGTMMAARFSSALIPLEMGGTNPWLAGVFLLTFCLLALRAYRVYLHPFAHIPGPLAAKCSWLWLHYHAYVGDECTQIRRLHEKYGLVVRVAPNEVDIADGDAIAPHLLGQDRPAQVAALQQVRRRHPRDRILDARDGGQVGAPQSRDASLLGFGGSGNPRRSSRTALRSSSPD
jgi:hypothetical protein